MALTCPHRQELIQVLACTAVTTVLGIVLGLGIFRMVEAQAAAPVLWTV